jgi:hypothetical protein
VRIAWVRSSISSWNWWAPSETTARERSPRLISTALAFRRPTRDTRAIATVMPCPSAAVRRRMIAPPTMWFSTRSWIAGTANTRMIPTMR